MKKHYLVLGNSESVDDDLDRVKYFEQRRDLGLKNASGTGDTGNTRIKYAHHCAKLQVKVWVCLASFVLL